MRVRRGQTVVPMPVATMTSPVRPVAASGVPWYVTYVTHSCCGREMVRVRVTAPTEEQAVEEARMHAGHAMGVVVEVRRA